MRCESALIAVALAVPTLVTMVYFVLLDGSPALLQQGAYLAGKIIQFGLPAVWVIRLAKDTNRVGWPRAKGLFAGLALGGLIALAMAGLYLGWLRPSGFFTSALPVIRGKVSGIGIEAPGKYLAVSVFYSLIHSGLEEYYWRWFVFGALRTRTRFAPAAALSSLGFMAHHVLVLALYFGWANPATWLLSVSVAIGGLLWAALYERTSSLAGPWLSHLMVDAAIFAIGYDLLTT